MAEELGNLKDDKKIVNQAISDSQKEILKELRKGTIDLKKAISELTNVSKNDIIATKQRINDLKSLNDAIKQNTNIQKQALDTSKRNNISDQAKVADKDSFENAYRVRQRFGGVQTMMDGNILSGITQIVGSFKGGTKFLNHPVILALAIVTKGLLKLDEALAAATKSVAGLTGGLDSAFLNKSGWASIAFRGDLKNNLYDIGMQGEFKNILDALSKGYGMATYQGQQKDFVTSMAYAQKGLGAYGVSADSSNSLLSNLRLLEGKNTTGVYAQLDRLTKSFSAMKYFSPDQAMQQMSSLFDQTKMLGTNFEWANRAIKQFERNLKDGTATLSDFAAINKGIRGGGLSKNAGVADMIINFASRAGYNLPTELLQSDAIGRGFAISTKSILSNNQFALATQGKIQEELDMMGGATKQDKAGRLSMLLNSWFGTNISQEVAEKAIKADGSVDLIGSKILGTKMGEREEKEKQRAEDYQKKVEKYYDASTSWHKQVLTDLGKIVSNTTSKFSKGVSGEVSSDPNFLEGLGYSVRVLGSMLGIVSLNDTVKDPNAPINPNKVQ